MIDPQLAEPGSREAQLLAGLDAARLPRHLAVIMDGNGRWARARRLPRTVGHREGVVAAREIVEVSGRLGIAVLTLFAFSSENWSRPPAEIETLFRLLRDYLRSDLEQLVRNNVRLRAIGRLDDLPPAVRSDVARAIDETAGNDGMQLCVALSYGGRAEIVDACRAMLRDGIAPELVDEALVGRYLYAPDLPEPDLLVRTSGEARLSNFLLWQMAYAEIVFSPVLWPDFRRGHLFEALADYQRRERRYGGVEPARSRLAAALMRG
jgi:undecaprenyl diphosphate synthase